MAITAIPLTYGETNFRSSLEADWAATFESLDMHWTYESEGYCIDGETWYLPDFWLPSQRVFAEVKGPMDDRLHKPQELQRALTRDNPAEWDFHCPLVVVLRPAARGRAVWEGSIEGQDPVVVLCPHCQYFGFMDYAGGWRCRQYCKNKTNKFWNEPNGGIWWPGELPFVRAPRPERKDD